MHRLKHLLAAGIAVAASAMWVGCASGPEEIDETAEVERLQLRIGEVRFAIDETRRTIARSQGAEYLPELYMRLAELLSEEARYHYQLARQRERGDHDQDMYVPEVRLLKNEAIDIYRSTVRRFPDSQQAPRMLFNMGHEHRELGNFEDMQAAMQRVVAEYPDHPLRFQALIVLGDYEFDRQEMDEAAYYYSQIIEGDVNSATGLAHYKMAWVQMNHGDCVPAIDEFESAMEASRRWSQREQEYADSQALEMAEDLPGVDQALDVERNALVDVAYCYSQQREPEDAVDYFQRWANNRATYVAGLGALARRYRIMDQFEGARDVTRELLEFGTADYGRLEDARTLYVSLTELEDYGSIASDIDLINSALKKFHGRVSVDGVESKELFDEFEVYARDLITRAQEEMQQATSGKEAFAEEVAVAYRDYLDTYIESPQRVAMYLNLVETLEDADQYFEAGQVGLEIAESIEDPEEQRDAYYDAVVNFQRALDEDIRRRRYESQVARASLRSAGEQLLELGFDDDDRRRRVKFAIGESHFHAGEFDQAIDKLALVAYQFPGSDQAEDAIRMALDSYRTLSDYEGLVAATERFLAPGSPASAELQSEIEEMQLAAEQARLDQLTLAAAGEEDVDTGPLEDFAQVHAGTERGENALLNAFVVARSSGETDKMEEVAEQLAREYPESEELPGIFSTLAQMMAAQFDYDRAIQSLEEAAEYAPDERTRYLTAAGNLKRELGQYEEAESLYRRAINATDEPVVRSEALDNLAIVLERHNAPGRMVRELLPYSDEAGPEVLVRIGLGLLAEGNADEAAGYFQQVSGAGAASTGAVARAEYGLAEVMLATLKNDFPDLDDFSVIRDYITVVDVTRQNYMNAARQGSRRYTTVALSRLAYAMEHAYEALSNVRLPGDLDAGQREQIQQAIDNRLNNLESSREQALETCAARMWNNHLFDKVVQRCHQGQPWGQTLANYESTRQRASRQFGEEVQHLRERVARNPQDVDALRQLGELFLDGGDPHLARLTLERAVSSGGGDEERNLLGVARYESGDISGAFQAFSRAADGGEAAAINNLRTLLVENGGSELTDTIAEQFTAEREGGREI